MVTDWRAAGAVLASIGIFGLALGLSYPLLSLLLKARGVSDTMIGINSAMTGVGMLLSCALLPRLLCLAGARRLMLAGLIGSAGTMLAFPLFDSLAVWFVLRVMLAFSLNMSFVVAEAWMNSIAADAARGRVMGLFTTVNVAGFGLGSSLLAVTGTASWTPFVVCATIIVVGASPLVVVQRSMADEWNDGVSLRAMTQFLAATPILVLAVLAYACFDATILTLLPVYALVQGWTPEFGALAVSAFLFGMVATQMPIGWLLDRFPKVHVLVGCALLTALACVAIPASFLVAHALWPVVFVAGGASFGLYTGALSILGERYAGGMLVIGSACFAMLYGVGAAMGPAATGPMMDWLGADALPYGSAVLFGAVAAAIATCAARPRRRVRAPTAPSVLDEAGCSLSAGRPGRASGPRPSRTKSGRAG